MADIYHRGEKIVQALAGEQRAAELNGRSIRNEIPKGAEKFLHQQQMLVAGIQDANGHIWCSMLTGDPPLFIRVTSSQMIEIEANQWTGDPFWEHISFLKPIGLLAIDLQKRRRMRLNGTISKKDASGISVKVNQAYSNCPKYIQARTLKDTFSGTRRSIFIKEDESMTSNQKNWVRQADTFFISTSSSDGQMDTSHRGGAPGFVQVADDVIRFPDYFGNSMFNTLGNIAENPATGLLFIDFTSGNTLQLSGRAEINWDQKAYSSFPGAERLVHF